ncbi:MAG: DNA polymerase, partial [Fermentimonas sp.]
MQAFSFVEYAKSTYGIDITLDEAMMIRQAFFDMYPELEVYYAKVNNDMMNYSKQTSIMGREYHLSAQKLINPYKRADYLRAAINFPVQSPASDYVLSG